MMVKITGMIPAAYVTCNFVFCSNDSSARNSSVLLSSSDGRYLTGSKVSPDSKEIIIRLTVSVFSFAKRMAIFE